MSDLHDLPLFGGRPVEDQPSVERRPAKKPRRQRAPRPADAEPQIVALPLARNRQVVEHLSSLFQATAPGPNRAAAFRRDVLAPFVAQRLALGLSSSQLNGEMLALEEGMVRRILGEGRDAGSVA